MKSSHLAIPAAAGLLLSLAACDKDISEIGSSVSRGEVAIVVDSLIYKLDAYPEYRAEYDSRSTATLIGRISAKEYGDLKCAFVSQLLPATSIGIPDSIGREKVDSMRMVINVLRGDLTGDSLAPQQLKVYALTKSLPSDLTNRFDPTGYYNPSKPLGTRSYALNALGKNDTVYVKSKSIDISVPLPTAMALDVFDAYRTNPSIFEWPQDFAKRFPGIYVEPTFGRGCIANVNTVNFYLYYHYPTTTTVIENDEAVAKVITKKDSVSLFTVAPEVSSANILRYDVSDYIKGMADTGYSLTTSPGGYVTRIKFPADKIIESYRNSNSTMGVVSNLTFAIPAQPIENSLNIGVPPFLALIKTSEIEAFFRENRIPDNKTSFWSTYDSTTGRYRFTSMRDYILDLMESGKQLTEEDMDFTILPVNIVTEIETNQYTGESKTYVVRCSQYMTRPTMVRLDTDNSVICFTYSLQTIK